MKNSRLLNAPLSHAVALMGHGDGLCVADAGLPISAGLQRIDLALSPGIPGFMDVLDVILSELIVEKVLLAKEIRNHNPEILKRVLNLMGDSRIEYVSHEEFKRRSRESKVIVRTGECSPYANIIFYSGVSF